MTPFLAKYLCDPVTREPLRLVNARKGADGRILAGELVSPSGGVYPVRDGIPRFVDPSLVEAVASFGNQWNRFDFDFKENWLAHSVAHTFGNPEVFRGRLIVDAGGGAGRQTRWFLEHGAKHVILLELSHAVDGIVRRNLGGFSNVDVIQCSIDAPPLRDGSIDGLVYCHNVIQHTPSVETTAQALWRLVAPGGELVFNCYGVNDQGWLRWIRFHLVYGFFRATIPRLPLRLRLLYAAAMGWLRLVPGLGCFLEKAEFCVQGDVPDRPGESRLERLRRRYRLTVVNTFDKYGAHRYQHHKTEEEIRALVCSLQPDPGKVYNLDAYFRRPQPIGCAIRLVRSPQTCAG